MKTIVELPCGCKIVEEADERAKDTFLRLVGCKDHPFNQGPDSATRKITNYILALEAVREKVALLKDSELKKASHATTCKNCDLDTETFCAIYDELWLQWTFATKELWDALDRVGAPEDQKDIPKLIRDIMDGPGQHRIMGHEIRAEYLQNPNFMVFLIKGICQDLILKERIERSSDLKFGP